MNMPTPEEMKRIRKSLHLTQGKAAALVHCTETTWRRWENGQRTINPTHWELFLLKTKR